VADARWIDLDGAANVRDLGGLPTAGGAHTRPERLIRSDNLQGLSAADVRRLVDDHGVRAVADLRSKVEVDLEGPGPMTREAAVDVQHFSLFPEAGEHTDAAADEPGDDVADAPVVLPWQTRGDVPADGDRRGTSAIYLRYLDDRADSVIAALRLIAYTDGATVVHCAAGKDRTGVVVAFALAEVGVTREAIVEDYARSGERIEAIFARLSASPTYRDDVRQAPVDKHRPRAATMERLLDAMEAIHGGVPAWLREHGWTEEDAAALRQHLLG
jgi:protein tyrosine/serine phosphatase